VILGIVGSRKLKGSLRAYQIIQSYIEALKPDQITSGGAIGIDNMGMEVALALGYTEDQLIIHLPKPRDKSRSSYIAACFVRNTLIAQDCHDLLALMPPGGSSGTLDTVQKARNMDKTVYAIYVEDD
jgi:predicted Rossmann fold nucleotide-binding protein DprA/Smf involved in DNA uptake